MQNNFREVEELVFFDLGIPDSDFRFPVWFPDSGFRIPNSDFRIPVYVSGFRIPDFGFRIPDSGFRIPVSEFDFRV